MQRRTNCWTFVWLSLLGTTALAGPPQVLIGVDNAAESLMEVDYTTGNAIVIGPMSESIVGAITYDHIHDILYGVNATTHNLLTIDPKTGDTTVIGPLGGDYSIIAAEYHPIHNVIYAMQPILKGSELYIINPETGNAFLIGTSDVVTKPGDLAYDLAHDVMYISDLDGILYSIDLNDTSVQFVMNIGRYASGVGMAYRCGVGLIASGHNFNNDPDDILFEYDLSAGSADTIGPIGSGSMIALTFIGAPTPRGDLTGNCVIDAFDLAILLAIWGPCSGDCAADLDGNGVVDPVDLAVLLSNWS